MITVVGPSEDSESDELVVGGLSTGTVAFPGSATVTLSKPAALNIDKALL